MQLARAREMSVNKLIDEVATMLLTGAGRGE
jgi:predicted DNA-binding ribbon-helix-helix protein